MRPMPLFVFVSLVTLLGSAHANTLRVPGDYATIQAAIDASVNDDLILVDPGTYAETIDFDGKAVKLFATQGPSVTVLTASTTIVTFANGETRGAWLEGFHITGSRDSLLGGGILCEGASPTIRGNWIRTNQAEKGAAIYCASFASPLICVNKIASNTSMDDGGGIASEQASPVIVDNSFEWNTARYDGKYAGAGGALYANESDIFVFRNVFRGNDSYNGGAILARRSTVTLEANLFVSNVSHGSSYYGSGGWGGAANLVTGTFSSKGDIFARNRARGNSYAPGLGGGVYTNQIDMIHSTFVYNVCDGGSGDGGGLYCSLGTTLDACIFWQNTANFGSQISDSRAVVTYSDVEGGFDGLGNIDADPMFRDAGNNDFRLSPLSPCIDSGNPDIACAGTDIVHHPRVLDGDLDGIATVDMGAFEFDNVDVAMNGVPTPGGTITIVTEGTPELLVFLVSGTAEGELCLDRYGSLLIDFASSCCWMAWGVIPPSGSFSVDVLIPANVPTPTQVYLQELALVPGARIGNFSNLLDINIE